MTANLSPELRLIMACVRRVLGDGTDALIERAASEPIDWQLFRDQTAEHGLAPLAHVALKTAPTGAPEALLASLHASCAAAAVHHKTGFEPTLALALDAMAEAGVRPIVLKGGALKYTAYPNPLYRTLVDIDLLVHPNELSASHGALVARRFQISDVALPRGHHHLPPYLSPDRRFAVELHTHVLAEGGPYAVDLASLHERAEVRKLGLCEARVLSATDALLHVCVHLAYGHRYQWFPLRALADILAITTNWADIDWKLLVATTRVTRAAGAAYWPLWLSREWLGAPVPDDVLHQLAPSTLIQRLVAPVINSRYVLDQAAAGAGAGVLYSALRELSLYTGCSRRSQVGAMLRSVFPSPDGVGHLPERTTGSRLRYGAYLGRPQRIVRGAWAVGTLLTRRPGRKRRSAPGWPHETTLRTGSTPAVNSLPGEPGIGVP